MPADSARAEGVVDRVARSGELVLVGLPDQAPLLSLDGQGRPVGYAMEVANRIAAELAVAVGRPVRLRFEPVTDPADLGQRLVGGKADLACGVPFTWERDITLDYSLPFGLSGLRLLAPAGRLDGSPQSLAGRRIGVVANSLGETELKGLQPAARPVGFADLSQAVAALRGGSVDGVIGDSTLLAGLVAGGKDAALAQTPSDPYERYAVACLIPENDSAFRNLVNLAIARLLQGYLDGQPEAVSSIDRWVGPGSALNRTPDQIRNYFDAVLLGVEALRPLPAQAGAPSASPAAP
ncbi:extracellular substrate binding-like orphan protein GrrP [Synechococcus sp. RedBA-s]|uniref:extracellular substrate binding-like orphan protein GrrP n=1 Tax=Synechococcus sp. RedBA-s TaxID=2823741 RepID=UPI0020CBF850|nr:extracellular substrate binding-like orphan protein GrrP [Synechococcus sp. RedBA-s]MCP9801180.1 extracellular substrate binding-like orphan protein GrrP [Synechococcus sp. RedBA-s]